MTPEEMQAEMDRLQKMGAFSGSGQPMQNAVDRSQAGIAGMNSQMTAMQQGGAFEGAEPPGLLSRLGTGINNFRQDPEKMARLTMGLNSMRLNPSQGIANSAANTIELGQERRQNTMDATATMQFLQSRAATDPMAAQALAAIKANPSMVKDIMGAYLAGQFKSPHMSKNIGSVQTAQEDIPNLGLKAGDQFTYTLDPNTQQYKLESLGGRGLTDAGRAELESDASLRQSDIEAARNKAKEYFNRYDSVTQQTQSLRQARKLIEKGAATGFLQQYFPAFKANTQLLRNVANEMGIDIINSATFGALSATELKLALSTGFPQGMSEEQTLKYIDEKIRVQDKFRRELLKKTNRLNSGIGMTQWTREIMEQEEAEFSVANPPQNNPALIELSAEKGMSVQSIWESMNYTQRKAFMEAES